MENENNVVNEQVETIASEVETEAEQQTLTQEEVNRLMRIFNTSKYESMRLIRTEHQRVNMQVQHEMAVQNNFTHYTYVAEVGACPHCASLAGKSFKMEDYEMGVTAPIMHPNCRCSVYHHIEMVYTDGRKTTDDMDIASKGDFI